MGVLLVIRRATTDAMALSMPKGRKNQHDLCLRGNDEPEVGQSVPKDRGQTPAIS